MFPCVWPSLRILNLCETTCKYEAQATERKGIGNRKKENAVQWSLNFCSKRNGYTQPSIRENFTYLKRKSVNSQLKAQPNKILQSASVIRTSLGSLTTVGNTGFTGHCQNNPWQREKNNPRLPRPGIIQSSCEPSGFEPGTFRSSVWRSPNWAISASDSPDSQAPTFNVDVLIFLESSLFYICLEPTPVPRRLTFLKTVIYHSHFGLTGFLNKG